MKSLEELRAIRAKMQGKVGVRAENENQIRVVVGMATCGIASGARPVLTALSDAVQEQNLSEKICVTQTGCIGLCQYEPIVEVMEPGKEKVTYVKMTPEKALEVLRLHLQALVVQQRELRLQHFVLQRLLHRLLRQRAQRHLVAGPHRDPIWSPYGPHSITTVAP